MKIQLRHSFEEIISIENLLAAWQEFVLGKRAKPDVQRFARHLMDNILQLYHELGNGSYAHNGYRTFFISDPKPRRIDKASVRDRLVHHAVYRVLYPFFDRTFIADSFSCREGKGVHKAVARFQHAAYIIGRNNTRTCWVLQCDIRKFFASIDHEILLQIVRASIPDERIIGLLQNIVASFSIAPGRGLPLGNLTSQLFVNVYMNEFDRFVKHRLKARHYVRYADDFVFFSQDRAHLAALVPQVENFLAERLRLSLHPRKIVLHTLASGADFLGWVNFSHHRILRYATRRRMMRRLQEHATEETLQSYLGLLQHGDTNKVRQEVLNSYWLFRLS